jgi:hypothetical protein
MLKQALLKILSDTSVVDHLTRLTHKNINVHELLDLAGLPSRSLWSALRKVKTSRPPSLCYGVAAFAFPLRSKAKAGLLNAPPKATIWKHEGAQKVRRF